MRHCYDVQVSSKLRKKSQKEISTTKKPLKYRQNRIGPTSFSFLEANGKFQPWFNLERWTEIHTFTSSLCLAIQLLVNWAEPPPKETRIPQPENGHEISNSSTGWHEQIFWQRTTEIKGEPAKLGLRTNNQEEARSIMSNLGPKLFMGAQNMKFDLYKIWQLYSGLIYQEKVEPNMYAMSKAKTPELWKTGRTLNKNPATTLRAWEVAAASVKTSSTFAGHRVGDASAPTMMWCMVKPKVHPLSIAIKHH